MANQITDNRILVVDADTLAPWRDLGNQPLDAAFHDFNVKIQGTASVSQNVNNQRTGILFDAGAAQNWSNNVFYLWINVGVVGMLRTKALGGCTIRFCGANINDWFEFNVGGNDSWPLAVEGGWVQFVVDIEGVPSATGGAAPLTSAIRYVGMTTISTVAQWQPTGWVDEIRRLPDGTPGIIVEGRNGGTVDWNSADIHTQLTTASGMFVPTTAGGWKINAPIQFGINDVTVHGFADKNALWLWDNQEFVPTGHYKMSALGNVGGTTSVKLGLKTGTGDDATGAQGLTIVAAATGVRWDIDFNDPDLDSIWLHGCSFQHGGNLLLNDPAVSCISTLYIGCSSASVANSQQLRCSVINANTLDGVSFMATDKLDDIVFCTFEFSDGHGVELTAPNTPTHLSKGNTFTNYALQGGLANDRALYNNSGAGLVTINVTDSGTDISYRNGTSATTAVVLNPVTLQLHVIDQVSGANLLNARAYVVADVIGPLPFQDSVTITRSVSTATVTHTAHGLANNDKVLIAGADQIEYNGIQTISNVSANAYVYTVSGTPVTPATGIIVATAIIIDGLTDASGLISDTRTYASSQAFTGRVRRASAAPYYKTAPISGTIDSGTGLTSTVGMIPDE